MKKNPLIISVTAALLGMGVFQLYVGRLKGEISGGPRTAVLIAAADIAAGSVIEREMLGVRELPRAYLEQRHIKETEADRVIGAHAGTAVKADESLLWTDVAVFQSERGTLSGLVQEGMRAITISAGSSDLSGLIRPGDRVDVLFTRSEGRSGGGRFTSTLLQNLLVLAVGADIGDSDQGIKRYRYWSRGSVTLSATIDQAQLLTQAEHQGRLKLALRNPDDIVQSTELPVTTAAEVSGPGRGKGPSGLLAQGRSGREIDHVR